jgi:hypothetical protein
LGTSWIAGGPAGGGTALAHPATVKASRSTTARFMAARTSFPGTRFRAFFQRIGRGGDRDFKGIVAIRRLIARFLTNRDDHPPRGAVD